MKKLLAAAGLLLMSLTAVGIAAALLLGPRPERYTVVRGDTLGAIARSHGVTLDELRSWNDVEGDLIEVGQVLLIWSHGSSTAATAATTHKRVGGTSVGPGAAPQQARLARPTAKPCLASPTGEGLADEEMVASQGLSYEQIAEVMRAFAGNTLSCVPEGTTPSGTVQTEITVACSGLVSHVEILDDGGLPGEMVDCVAETLTYAAFPAHDLPDGETFGYPLTFSF